MGPQQPDRAEHLQAFERPDDNSRLAPRQPRSDGCVEDATYRTDSLGSINPVALKVKEHDPSLSCCASFRSGDEVYVSMS